MSAPFSLQITPVDDHFEYAFQVASPDGVRSLGNLSDIALCWLYRYPFLTFCRKLENDPHEVWDCDPDAVREACRKMIEEYK